jgi:hypothetical protein
MSAIAAGQLVKSHMKYNRSSKDITKIVSWTGLTQHNNKLVEGTNASNKDKKRPKREYIVGFQRTIGGGHGWIKKLWLASFQEYIQLNKSMW